MKLAWLYRRDPEDRWELMSEYDRYLSGEWQRIVYCEVEE